ncbi:hypothetical protein HDK77DRAFT_154321 [Phyllosticta capitalensis]|uniref:uncharacterized protein n=1 Tax=Phyllosticta capitalensis TaxID=121624 RepID=UPI00312E4E53
MPSLVMMFWLVTLLWASHASASPGPIRPFPTNNNATFKLGSGAFFTPLPTGALGVAATGNGVGILASPTCTTKIFGGRKFGPLSRAECTFYDSYTTTTEYVDCGGCALETLNFGHGPVVKCGKYVQLPVGTITATSCKDDRGGVAPPTGNPAGPPKVVARPPAGGYYGGGGW